GGAGADPHHQADLQDVARGRDRRVPASEGVADRVVDAEVERVLGAVGATGLLHPGDALVVLVSGGRDSVCLLDVAATICGPDRLVALHVDYRLRGVASDADAEHVRRVCGAAGVALEVRRAPDPPAAGNRQGW